MPQIQFGTDRTGNAGQQALPGRVFRIESNSWPFLPPDTKGKIMKLYRISCAQRQDPSLTLNTGDTVSARTC
jgi:hypothetical protein